MGCLSKYGFILPLNKFNKFFCGQFKCFFLITWSGISIFCAVQKSVQRGSELAWEQEIACCIWIIDLFCCCFFFSPLVLMWNKLAEVWSHTIALDYKKKSTGVYTKAECQSKTCWKHSSFSNETLWRVHFCVWFLRRSSAVSATETPHHFNLHRLMVQNLCVVVFFQISKCGKYM